MKPLLSLISFFVLLLVVLLALSVGTGSLLHWLVPDIDVGSGTVVGCIAIGASFYCLLQMVQMVVVSRANNEEDEE